VSRKGTETSFFLVSHQAKTIRLNKQQPTTIGREKYNDVVLNDLLVSRQHAVIRWEKDHFLLKDLKSRNGTYLNNDRIEQEKLNDGDLLKIGAYEFYFRAATPMDVEKHLLQERVRMASQETMVDADLGIRFSDSGFSGTLSSLALLEVIQTLNQCLKTGVLTIVGDAAVGLGHIYFEDGEIVHAQIGSEEAFSALMVMMYLTDGQFEFQNDVPSPVKTINQPTMGILLEACRRKDEAHRENTRS